MAKKEGVSIVIEGEEEVKNLELSEFDRKFLKALFGAQSKFIEKIVDPYKVKMLVIKFLERYQRAQNINDREEICMGLLLLSLDIDPNMGPIGKRRRMKV